MTSKSCSTWELPTDQVSVQHDGKLISDTSSQIADYSLDLPFVLSKQASMMYCLYTYIYTYWGVLCIILAVCTATKGLVCGIPYGSDGVTVTLYLILQV